MPRKTTNATNRAAKGEAMRRRVLGDAHVDRSLAERDALSDEFTTLIHEWVWHDIWSRETLPLKTRSLINVALLAALNRPREIRIHLRGALNNGCTIDEIREVLMHTSLYAGVPATLDGMHAVREALKDWGMGDLLKRTSAGKPSRKRGEKSP